MHRRANLSKQAPSGAHHAADLAGMSIHSKGLHLNFHTLQGNNMNLPKTEGDSHYPPTQATWMKSYCHELQSFYESFCQAMAL